MKIPFTKMQALGNDFVVFDFTQSSTDISPDQARLIADRHLGIGCDQILILQSSTRPEIDFRYRIMNSDGSEVAQCGNGARCMLKFIHQQGLSSKQSIVLETQADVLQLHYDVDCDQYQVELGHPAFRPEDIPMQIAQQAQSYTLSVDDQDVAFHALAIGNPHAVIEVADVSRCDIQRIGPALELHPVFPQRANVGFMQIIDRSHIALRVHERGAGETRACGSGAAAAAVAGMQAGALDERVQVSLPGGKLSIVWQGPGHPVSVTGPAETSFHGEIEIR